MSDDIDIGEISEALNDKMDRDAGNPDSIAIDRIIGWMMPDYANGVSKVDNTEYTATTNGWLEIFTSCFNSSAFSTLIINGVSRNIATAASNHLNLNYCIVPIYKGTTYKVVFARANADQYINFYPCIGG